MIMKKEDVLREALAEKERSSHDSVYTTVKAVKYLVFGFVCLFMIIGCFSICY